MKRAASRLQNHGHCAGGGKSIVSAVVRSELTELSDSIRGGRNAHATGAATVVIFSTVEQIDVVVLTHAVKLHAGVSTNWSVDESGDLARRSRRQRSQLVDAATIHSDLAHLLFVNDVADLTSVGLHADGVGFNSNRFRCRAQRHLEIHASAVADLQHQALLLCNLESRGFGLNVVVADWQVDRYILASFVRGERVR